MLTCSRCRECKSDEEFHLARSLARGRQFWCKTCTKKAYADWYERHRLQKLSQVAAAYAARKEQT